MNVTHYWHLSVDIKENELIKWISRYQDERLNWHALMKFKIITEMQKWN